MKKFFSFILVLLTAGNMYAADITVAEAISIGQALAENNVATSETYSIVGYVNVIDENSFSTTYNNMTFWIADTRGTSKSYSNALQCYRCRPDRELQVGDKVRVVAPLKKYNSKVETAQTNAPVTWLESAPETPAFDTIKGSFRVCAQNLENYYYNLNTGRGNYTEAERAAKTRKIVNMMLSVDADIYAFCELEAKPIILAQLADSANARINGSAPYVAVADGIDVDWSEDADYNLKSGFIYRSDRVAPVGASTGGTSGNGYYAHTMRIQTFKQLSSNEKLVVSMNHFKSKIGDDQGESQRITNATNLVNSLAKISADPDILILGDLNCEYGEEPMNILANAGYDEQILRFDSAAYSHCYSNGELIDHVLANASMKEQIVCTYVKHVSAYKCNPALSKSDSYSDHDPLVVEINLESSVTPPSEECQDIDVTYLASNLDNMTTDGDAQWKWDSQYNCAKVSKSGGYTGYMFTPVYNFEGASSVSMNFSHAHKYAGTPSNELTLWVTKNFQGSFEDSEWQQLTISPYTSNSNFNFSDVTINVPTDKVGARTAFAFKYMSTASNYATWEIKNLRITAKCEDLTSINETTEVEQKAIRFIHNGQLFIRLNDGTTYSVFGVRVQ